MRMASCPGSFLARLVQFQRTLVGLEFLFCRFPNKYKRAADTDRTKRISLTSHNAITIIQFNENVSAVLLLEVNGLALSSRYGESRKFYVLQEALTLKEFNKSSH